MSYLAYDPARISSLAGALHAAFDELGTFTCDDPAAADAAGRVRHARLHLDQLWLPLVERIDRCDPLGNVGRVGLALDDITDQLMRTMRDRSGWQIAHDGNLPALPTGALPGAPPTPEQVRALADLLQHGDLASLIDAPDERAWLSAELQLIVADPTLAAELDAGFDRWGAFADELGYVRMHLTGAPTDNATAVDVGHVDEVFAALATVTRDLHGAGAIAAATRTMEPYAAAALIRQAGLDPITLSWLSVEVLHRLDSERPGTWREDWQPGPKTGDLLFETVLATPGAANRFVVEVAPQPELLWWTASDATLAQRVAARGTDPAHSSTVEAHVVLHAFADWFEHVDAWSRNNLRFTARPAASRAFLGALAAPWLVEYGPGSDDWGVDARRRRADLAFIIGDRQARDALFAQLDQEVNGLGAPPQRHRDGEAAAAAIGMLLQLDLERKVRAAADAEESWDATWGLVSRSVGYAGSFAGPEGVAIAKVVSRALTRVKDLADRNGWLGAPPPTGDVAERAAAEQRRVLLGSSAVAVMAGYLALVDRGGLPPSTPAPPVPSGAHPDDVQAYWRAYRDWKAANIPEGCAAELLLDEQYHLFLSDADLGIRLPG